MKKLMMRDKKLGLSRETVRELTTPQDHAALRHVVGGGSCNLTPSTHGGAINCVPER